MTITTSLKAISLATVIAVSTAFSSTAFAHDTSKTQYDVTPSTIKHHVTKKNARKLVNALLNRDYKGQGFKAREMQKEKGQWNVAIKYNLKRVATAYVDRKTGNIQVQND